MVKGKKRRKCRISPFDPFKAEIKIMDIPSRSTIDKFSFGNRDELQKNLDAFFRKKFK